MSEPTPELVPICPYDTINGSEPDLIQKIRQQDSDPTEEPTVGILLSLLQREGSEFTFGDFEYRLISAFRPEPRERREFKVDLENSWIRVRELVEAEATRHQIERAERSC